MRRRILWTALLMALLPSIGFAACNPPQSPLGSLGCQPPLGTPQNTDLIMAWRPSIFPNSLGSYTASDLAAWISSASGFVTGPPTTTIGHLATWANIAGTQLADTALLNVSLGGTGAATLTAHGILLGEGTSAVTPTAVMTNGQLLVGQTAADPLPKTVSGDATVAASGALTVTGINGAALGSTTATSGNILIGSGTQWVSHALSGDATLGSGGALTLATVNSNTGAFGDATHVPQVTLNAKGLVTAASSVLITGTTPGGSASGDLSGSYPGPTVAKINGVALGTVTATSGNDLVANGTQWVSVSTSGDCTRASSGAITCTKTNGSSFGTAATVNTGTSGATIPLLNGKNVWSNQQSVTPTTLTISGSTFTPDQSSNNYSITLVHASCPCTLANPSGTAVAGTGGQIIVIQSATGSDTIGTWGSEYEASGGTSTLTLSTGANAVDVLSYYVRDSTHIELSLLTNFSH